MSVIKLSTLPVTIDADKIAKGVIRMMEEAGDDESLTVMKFGMLPKKWIDMIEEQMRASFREKLMLVGGKDERTVIYDGQIVTFSFDELIQEALHEICLALYSNTEMVV